MLQNGENDDFDDDFSMILGQLSNDKKMIKLREIIIFLSFESSFKSSFLGCSLRFPSKCFKMIEKVASHWKCGENDDFYDDLKDVFFVILETSLRGANIKQISKNNGYINEPFEN